MAANELLYIDTSVHIVRLLKGPAMRRRLQERAGGYLRSSGLVCRQEFKRRVIRDAIYLLDVLSRRSSYEDAHDDMMRLSQTQHHKRRANICLDLLKKHVTGNSDQEKFETIQIRLRTFILTALSQFDDWLDAPDGGPSECACGRGEVRERVRPRRGDVEYDTGDNECRRLAAGRCGIVNFLREREAERVAIRAYLKSLPPEQKTKEINAAEQFLDKIAADPAGAQAENPCSTVGDLLIALESVAAKAGVFYTLNWKESRYFCRMLQQTLIVRPPDSLKDDVVCDRADAANWPYFGTVSQPADDRVADEQ